MNTVVFYRSMKYLLLIISILPLTSAIERGNPSTSKLFVLNTIPIAGKKWAIQEIRFTQNNVPYYYNRNDKAATTINCDDEFIFFNADGTGLYHGSDNAEFSLTWHFKKGKENSIEFNITKKQNDTADLPVTWENIEVDETSIHYTEYYTLSNGIHSLANGIRSVTAIVRSTPIADKKWLMQEIRFLADNIPYYYKRNDDANSNMNFDNDYIFFSHDGTGTYHQTDAVMYPLTWHYKNKIENAIEFRISKFRNGHDLDVTWENIMLDKNAIKYTEYYTHSNGIHSLGNGVRSAETCNQADSYVVNGQ